MKESKIKMSTLIGKTFINLHKLYQKSLYSSITNENNQLKNLVVYRGYIIDIRDEKAFSSKEEIDTFMSLKNRLETSDLIKPYMK